MPFICELQKQLNILEFIQLHFEDGLKTTELIIKKLKEVNGFITFVLNLKNVNRKIRSFMHVYPLINKKMISKDRSSTLKLLNHHIRWLRILVLELTLNEKDCYLFLKKLIEDSSKKLWLPQKTECVDSVLNLSNGSLTKTMLNSQCLINKISHQNKSLQKISLSYYKSLHVDGMEKEDTILRIRKIRLQLTSIQKKVFQKWNDHVRYSYNKTIHFKNECSEPYSKLDLRNLITPSSVNQHIPWILETPKAVRESGVFEACKNYKSAFTNLRNGNIKYFKMSFRTKKKDSFTFGIPKESIFQSEINKYFILYPREFDLGIKTCEKLPLINNDCTIHFDGKDYYICIPIKVSKKQIYNRNTIISVDPNVVDIHTSYDPINKLLYEIGKGFSNSMFEKYLLKIDHFISKKDKETNNKKKKEINNRIIKLRNKLNNIQNDTHWKIANFYCNNYKNIVIPQFGSKEMVKKQDRVISSKIVRKMNTISHGKLLQKLKTKAEEKQTKVLIQEESYTTKTCGNCQYRQNDIGGKRTWVCSNCNFDHNRDANAARNILLKYLKTLLQDTALVDILCSCYMMFNFCYIM